MKFPKTGSLVEIHWLDAVFFMFASEVKKSTLERGGDILIACGYLVNENKNCIALAGELDDKREPSRDINIIPKCLIKKVVVR